MPALLHGRDVPSSGALTLLQVSCELDWDSNKHSGSCPGVHGVETPRLTTWTPGPISMKLTGDLLLTRVRARGRFPVSFEGPAVKVWGAHMQLQSPQPTVSMAQWSATGVQAMHAPPACIPIMKVRGAHIALLLPHHPTVSMEWHLAAGAWAMHPGMPAMKVWGAHMQPPTVSMEQQSATETWAMPAMVMLPGGLMVDQVPPSPKFPGRDWDKGLSGPASPQGSWGQWINWGTWWATPHILKKVSAKVSASSPSLDSPPLQTWGEAAVRPPGAVSPWKTKVVWSSPTLFWRWAGMLGGVPQRWQVDATFPLGVGQPRVNVPTHVKTDTPGVATWMLGSISTKLTGNLPQTKDHLPWRQWVDTSFPCAAALPRVNVPNHIQSCWPGTRHHPCTGPCLTTPGLNFSWKLNTWSNLLKTHKEPAP